MIALFVLLLMVFTNSMTVSATEIQPDTSSVEDKPPTGTKVGYCQVSFNIGYLGDKFKDNIAVIFTDISTGKEYQFLLESENGYNAGDTYNILANTTYTVTISYPNSDTYKVQNADGTEIEAYAATETGLTLLWQISEKTAEEESNTTHGEEDTTAVTPLEAKGDGAQMIKTFVDRTQFIENDKAYANFIGNWAGAVYEKLFLAVDGNTQEQWTAMTKYERACYSLLFLYPKSVILNANSSYNSADKMEFLKNLDVAKMPLQNIKKGDEVYQVLLEAWEWHWANWVNDGRFINPYENITYDKSNIEPDKDGIDIVAENQEKEKELDAAEIRDKLSSPQNFMQIIKDHIFSILLLIGAGITVAIVAYRNKKKNYDNDEE